MVFPIRAAIVVAALALAAALAAPAAAQPALPAADAWAKPFLDANGGYRDSRGGYYNVQAQTYEDGHGGTVDDYGGYTCPDGSYKTKLGDFYDAPKRTFFTTDGKATKVPDGVTTAQMIQALRDNVKANGGYDPDLVHSSMMASIRIDHPSAAPPLRP
jgi:hypothetical protein